MEAFMTILEKYAYAVYSFGSFSSAAKELFISQPALSSSIKRLEGELGFKLFDRSINPIAATAEGKIYFEHLVAAEESKRAMLSRIRSMKGEYGGTVSVGAYAYSAYPLLAGVCGEFAKEHPEVTVKLDMGSIGALTNLVEKLKRRELDLMLNYTFDPKEHSADAVLDERLIIAMKSSVAGAREIAHLAIDKKRIIERDYARDATAVDPSVFKDIKFLPYSVFSDTKKRMDLILGEYKTASCEVVGARQVSMHNRLMQNGVGAILTSDFHVRSGAFYSDDILYFVPRSEHAKRTLYMITQKNAEPSSAAKMLMQKILSFEL